MIKIMIIRDAVLFILFVVNVLWKGDTIPYVDEIAMGLGTLYFTWIRMIEWANKNPKWTKVVSFIVDHPSYKYMKEGYLLLIGTVLIVTGLFGVFLPAPVRWFFELLIISLALYVFWRYYKIYKVRMANTSN